jgi:hypothetical protein
MKLSLNNQLGRMHKQGTSAIEKAFFARNVDGIKEYVFSSEEKKKELVNSMKVRSSRLAMIKLQNEEKLKPSSVDPKTVRTDDMATEKPFAAERGGTGGTYGGTMAIELVNPENALEPMFGKQKANDVMFLTSLANAESLENSDFINMFPTDPNTSAHIYRYLIKGEPKNENEKGPLLRKIDAIIVSLRGLIPRQNILKHYSEKKMEVNSLMEGYKAFIRFYKK